MLRSSIWQRLAYNLFGENRDIDYEKLRLLHNWLGKGAIDIAASDFEAVVIEHVRGRNPVLTYVVFNLPTGLGFLCVKSDQLTVNINLTV